MSHVAHSFGHLEAPSSKLVGFEFSEIVLDISEMFSLISKVLKPLF